MQCFAVIYGAARYSTNVIPLYKMETVILIKEIISTEFARVAEYSISPETNGIQHYHNEVDEELYCLSGSLRIRVSGRVDKALKTGDKIENPAGVTHSVHNDAGNSSRYLVIQGNGEYDFIES